jgi:hypothetical protein
VDSIIKKRRYNMTKELVIFTAIIVIVGGIFIGINNVILTEAPGSAYDPVAPLAPFNPPEGLNNVDWGKVTVVTNVSRVYKNKYNNIGPVDFYVK